MPSAAVVIGALRVNLQYKQFSFAVGICGFSDPLISVTSVITSVYGPLSLKEQSEQDCNNSLPEEKYIFLQVWR